MNSGMSTGQVKLIALNFVESMNYNLPLDFRVRDTWKQLYGVDGVCGGAFHSAESKNDRGFVTVAAGNHKSTEAVHRTLQHEILGHYLINTYTPDEKRGVIGRIMASQDESSLTEHWRKVRSGYPDKSLSIQAEELFASIAERVTVDRTPKETHDPFLADDIPVTLQSIESSIQHRVNLLKEGRLEQQTFPDTDAHSGPFVGFNFERRIIEWRNSNPAAESSPQPSAPRL